MTFLLMSCDDIDITSPAGPQGKSAYQVWVDAVEDGEIQWPAGTDLANFFKYLQGEKGAKGDDAYQVWKEYISAGDVQDPHNPSQTWDPSRNTQVDYYTFLAGAKGDNAPPVVH